MQQMHKYNTETQNNTQTQKETGLTPSYTVELVKKCHKHTCKPHYYTNVTPDHTHAHTMCSGWHVGVMHST